MKGFSAKLPLKKDPIDGLYSMNKTGLDGIKQNFKMLLLTSPGERVMIPSFGVGLKSFLFQQKNEQLSDDIKERIYVQTARYLPQIQIDDIIIGSSEEVNNNENALYVRIIYQIPLYNFSDEFYLNIDSI